MPVKSNDQLQQEKAQLEQAINVATEQQKKAAADLLLNPTPKKTKEKSCKFIVAPQVKSKKWAAVIEAYNAKYSLNVDEKSDVLEFSSLEEAIRFFDAQAKAGHEFLARGQVSGHCVFSCGNNKLYQGPSLEKIKEQLETDSKKHPEDLKIKAGIESLTQAIEATKIAEEAANPTARMREQLKGHRKEPESKLVEAASPAP